MPPPEAGYVASSTFLRLRPDDHGNRRFGELKAPISAQREQQPGLEAIQLAVSGECKTARTLSVWASLDAMYGSGPFGNRYSRLAMNARPYAKGLVDLGRGLYAYLQPNGGWGWSNAGFIADGEHSLLVDTLFDERLTAEMLNSIERATGIAPAAIGTIVNTHANGDHTNGNALCEGAEIIASEASAREMNETPPQLLAQFKAAAGQLGIAGEYFAEIFGPFDFAAVRGRAPTRTFETRLELQVGHKRVLLTKVGPAHTQGDVLVHVPDDRAVFTGDILFINVTPIMWAGPVENWLAACDSILALEVDAIVPGHGPLADKSQVRRVREYLSYIDQEARKRFDAGLAADQAALDIALGDFDSWGDAERIAVNVDTLYRGYRADPVPTSPIALFELMGKIARERAAR